MYQITEQAHNKLLRIALALAGILLIGIILLVITSPSAPHKPPVTSILPTPTAVALPLTIDRSHIYRTKEYSLAFPATWSPQPLTLKNGGNFTTFHPASDPSGIKEYYPSAVVSVEPIASSSSIAQKAAIYELFGMQKTVIPFQGTQAVKVSGTFPIKIVSGQEVRQPVQKTLIFVQKGDKLYTLKYYYEGDKVNPQYEQFFTQLLTSFTFGQ